MRVGIFFIVKPVYILHLQAYCSYKHTGIASILVLQAYWYCKHTGIASILVLQRVVYKEVLNMRV